MSCERFREAITDHACGAPIDARAAAHLAECARCAQLFEDRRRVLAAADEELRSALSVIASADFTARVSRRVHSPQRSTNARAWWIGAAAVAAMVTIAVVFTWPVPSREQPGPSMANLTSSAQPSTVNGSAAATTPNVEVSPNRIARAKTVAKPAAIAHRQHEPEVIVPPDQQRAIARLTELIRAGMLDPKALPRQPRTEDLNIAPLSVPDIVVPDVEIIGTDGAQHE